DLRCAADGSDPFRTPVQDALAAPHAAAAAGASRRPRRRVGPGPPAREPPPPGGRRGRLPDSPRHASANSGRELLASGGSVARAGVSSRGSGANRAGGGGAADSRGPAARDLPSGDHRPSLLLAAGL